jgi:hypothetical protein
MAISSTSFFSSYQSTMGATYARGYDEVNNPASTLPTYQTARQLFLASMSTTDVNNGLTVVNSHLAAENTYSSGAMNIVKNVLTSLNNFFYSTYSVYTRDYFNSLTSATNVPWTNSFKEAWYQANTQELVQQIGFATYTGSNFVFYPASSAVTNVQNAVSIASTSGNNVTVAGYNYTIGNFALPGYYVVGSSTTSFPNASTISLSTTVTALYNTNTLTLSGPIGSATSLFAFRPLKNAEYLEFRWGSASVTGLAATSIFADMIFSVTLSNGNTTSVTVGAANTTGRTTIGTYGTSTYKTTGISAITLSTGSVASMGTQQSLEIWVKSTY